MAVERAAKAVADGPVISRRRERMRQILVEAAMRLFARQGVDATTIDEIVETAGVAKGTFYNYFTDRTEIAREVARTIRSEINDAVEELNEGIEDPAERISRGVRLYMAMVVHDPVKARMLARIYNGGIDMHRGLNQHLLGDIDEGLATGRIHAPGRETVLHFVLGVATAALAALIYEGAPEEVARGKGYAQDMTLLLLQGFGLQPAEIDDILRRPFEVSHLSIFRGAQ